MNSWHWQKSTYSPDGSNCLYAAAAPDGTLRLRESDDPEVVLTAGPDALRELIRGVKAGEFGTPAG